MVRVRGGVGFRVTRGNCPHHNAGPLTISDRDNGVLGPTPEFVVKGTHVSVLKHNVKYHFNDSGHSS